MSLTPIEGSNDTGDKAPDDRDEAGVRQRLWQAVTHIVRRVRLSLGGSTDTDGDEDAAESRDCNADEYETAIRPSGQARLASGREDRQLPEYSPPEPEGTDDGSPIEATVDSGTLHLQHEDSDEAYISSDVYEPIER